MSVDRKKRLPGSIWAVSTFFNPHSYQNKVENFRVFREAIGRQNIPLLVVEVTAPGHQRELKEHDADVLLHTTGTSVLWHKECALNIGIRALPGECDKVVWLDCDVLFQNHDWVAETAQGLENFIAVQPFDTCVRLERGATTCQPEQLPVGCAENQRFWSMGYGLERQPQDAASFDYLFSRDGHCGFAWAARREVVTRHGLYEHNLLGNGDRDIACAMYSQRVDNHLGRLSIKQVMHCLHWAREFHADVMGSVSYTPGALFHLWHGDYQDRRYDELLTVMVDTGYDPARDVARDEAGMLVWNSDKPALHDWCRENFGLRREDG